MAKLEECIFCECEPEHYEYGRTIDNDERAKSERSPWHSISSCQDCINKLKILIEDAPQEVSN